MSLDGDPAAGRGAGGRAGRAPTRTPRSTAVLAAVAESDCLRLRGLMAVAPLGREPDPAFERLAVVAEAVRGVSVGDGALSRHER